MKDEFHLVSKVTNAALPSRDTQERQVQLCLSSQQQVRKTTWYKQYVETVKSNIFGDSSLSFITLEQKQLLCANTSTTSY